MRLFRRIVKYFLAAMTMACFMWPMYLDHTLAYTMPTSPQLDQGRIHRIVVHHGSVVYVNERELRRADFVFHKIFLAGIVFAGLLGVLIVYWEPPGRAT